MWNDGERTYTDQELVHELKKHQTFFVGSDSQFKRHHVCYVTAICFPMNPGVGYFYKRQKLQRVSGDIKTRIWTEVQKSIDCALWLQSIFPDNEIEVHCDINSNPKYKSNQFDDMARGYVTGCGFKYRCKPEAFAASGAADNHTR